MIGRALVLVLAVGGTTRASSCQDETQSTTGLKRATVTVPTQTNGLTIEQQNVRDRLVLDNRPGAIKHLYVISAFSGDVLLYSTVRGKVTSSGKRLSPTSVATSANNCGIRVAIGTDWECTNEVLQDDGTYGTSVDYLYWWDAKGVYHQHYVAGGQIVHVSDQPLRVGKVLINLSPADGR